MLCFLRFFTRFTMSLRVMVAEFILYGNRTILLKSFVSASFLRVLLLSLCHPAIVVVLFVVRRSFVLSFSLYNRPCSLLPLLPLFFACCCCFSVPRPLRSAFRASRCYLCAPFAFFLLLFGVLLLFFLCLALFVLLSVCLLYTSPSPRD